MTSGDHLRARGRNVDVLFAFRDQAAAALIPPAAGLFFADVRLSPDAVVRCRFAGQPAALIEVAANLWLNIARLATLWPACVSELSQRVGPARLAAFLDGPATVMPLEGDALKSYILEHQIHAQDLHLLGDGEEVAVACAESANGSTFALQLPRGTLHLTYTGEAYRRAHAGRGSSVHGAASRPEVRWNGEPISLDVETPWVDDDLAEALVAGAHWVDADPEQARASLEALLEGSPELLYANAEAERATLTSELLNLLGVALRRLGRLDEALERFDQALAVAQERGLKTTQEIFYNRGFTRLQGTMIQTVQTGARLDRTALHLSSFDLDERFRVVWAASRADFEQALRLDPDDAVARAQLRVTNQLLALLDRPAGGGGSGAAAKSDRTPPPRNKPSARSIDWAAWILSAALVAVLVLVGRRLPHPSPVAPRVPDRLATPSVPAPEVVTDPWTVSEARRIKLITARNSATLAPRLTDALCPVAVPLPAAVPEDEVIAPYLGRGVRGELYGREYFDATLREYFDRFAPGTEALPLDPGAIGPLSAPDRARSRRSGSPVQLTLLVGAWRDPVFPPGSATRDTRYSPGAIRGRLVVWSYERSQIICAADVEATNAPKLTFVHSSGALKSSDDPLNRARVDLVEQALRAAIPRLRAVAVPSVRHD